MSKTLRALVLISLMMSAAVHAQDDELDALFGNKDEPKATQSTNIENAENQKNEEPEDDAVDKPLATIPVGEDASPPVRAPRRRLVIEEIVVTAQKREENLQDVPISVSAFTADQLADIGFDDVDDLVAYVPSLTVATNVSPLSTSFRIRNVGKFSAIPSFEPAVGLFIDGAFRARSGLGLGDLVDVNAIEVLKGPQSTLYGKNVSAGVISVGTAAPTRTFESMAELVGGSYELRQLKGYVSGPLSSDFSARLSGVSTKSGPHMTNLVGEDHDDRGSTAIRGQLLYEPNDRFSSRFIAGFVDKDFHPKQGDTFSSPAVVDIIRNAGGQVTNNDPSDGIVEFDDFNRFTVTATDFILNNKYVADSWSLTSISSYDQYDALSYLRDAEQMSLSIAIYDDTQVGNAFSQELKLDAALGERWNFLGGLYYLDSHFREGDPNRPEFVLEDEIEELGDAIAQYIATHQGPTPGSMLPSLPGPDIPLIGTEGDTGDFVAVLDTQAFGMFTKLDYALNEAWGLSLGLRYSTEEKTGTLVQSNQLAIPNCDIPEADTNFLCSVTPQDNNFDQSKTYDALTGSLQANYHWSDDIMLYASAAKGFKSGGFSLQNGASPADLRPYNSEDITSFELGWKSRFWGRRAQLNGALFHTQYDDYQEASYLGLFFVVNSAESVTVQGLELSGLLLLTDSLTASLDLAYIDSVYDKYTGGQCYYGRTPDNDQGQCDLSGEELPGSFELKGIASLQWERPLSSGQFYSRLDMAFGDTINTSSEIDPRFDQPALTLFNARIGWRTARWDISLGGKNLTNVNFVDQSANANVLTPIDEAVGSDIGSYQQYIGAPRELNLTVRMNY